MVKRGVTYEPELYTTPLTCEDTKFLKMYLITIGKPGSKRVDEAVVEDGDEDTPPKTHAKKKTLTAYVGASHSPTSTRVHKHNNIGVAHRNPRTRNGASRWNLAIVLFIPRVLRDILSSKVIHKYWDAAHGAGKLKRGLFLHRYLGLPCLVQDIAKDAMAEQNKKLKMPPFVRHSFKPKNIVNVNKQLCAL